MPGRSRGGNAAGNFHPRPGPASRLPRTGKRPPRGPRRSGKTTGGALGRRQTFTSPGADPAPRFPTAPDRESSLTMARPETGRGNGETCIHYPVTGSLTALRENAERAEHVSRKWPRFRDKTYVKSRT